MGNIKSTPHIAGNTAVNRRRSQQSINQSIKLPAVIEQPKRWDLSERDIAFLCSQTGKYKEIFKKNLIYSFYQLVLLISKIKYFNGFMP